MKIVFATGNAGKVKEIKKILSDVDADIITMKEAGVMYLNLNRFLSVWIGSIL